MTKDIEALKEISSWVAHNISQVQGAGGNNSVKTEDGKLIIKASGKNMVQLIEENAYVVVDNEKVKTLITNPNFDITDNIQVQAISSSIKNSVLEKSDSTWQPSMEVGFHSYLYKYTLHTHNVWSNVFMCSNHFFEIETLFANVTQYTLSSLADYYTPGIPLSWHIYNAYCFEEAFPNVIFIPNHGIIYSSNDLELLHKIVNEVEQTLYNKLKSTIQDYPTIAYNEKNNIINVTCPFLINNLSLELNSAVFIDLLFPDQAIYINKNDFNFDKNETSHFNIDLKNKQITSTVNLIHTKAVMETMIAYYYIINQCQLKGYEPLTINWEWQNLTAMPSEVHRITMLNN
jgi:rhamnose utilization protein RhaD (predicted bifunctional aldolase and dehydrogenase)